MVFTAIEPREPRTAVCLVKADVSPLVAKTQLPQGRVKSEEDEVFTPSAAAT